VAQRPLLKHRAPPAVVSRAPVASRGRAASTTLAARRDPLDARERALGDRILKQGLPPVIGPDAELLVLGSFPGEESLRQARYYAHPQYQFWRLLGDVVGVDLDAMPYAERLGALQRLRIGLWDIITGCEREGSLDGNIRNASLAQFEWLAEHAPHLSAVAMNGRKAGTAAKTLAAHGYRTVVLPSSSPAYTLPYAEKLAGWQALRPLLPSRGMRR